METMEALIRNAAALGVALTEEQISRFATYERELIAWNERINLTAIADPREVEIKHFADSLACLAALPAPRTGPLDVVDVGTGAGFPGLPLRICRPDLSLRLLDSTAKKTRFLAHLVRALDLEDVEVLTGRAEDLGRTPAHREAYDVATSRAVAQLAALAELCLPLLRVGGLMIAQKSAGIDEELRAAGRAIAILGGGLLPIRRYALPDLPEPRWLVLIEKVRPTPPAYPRRPGLPAKKPL